MLMRLGMGLNPRKLLTYDCHGSPPPERKPAPVPAESGEIHHGDRPDVEHARTSEACCAPSQHAGHRFGIDRRPADLAVEGLEVGAQPSRSTKRSIARSRRSAGTCRSRLNSQNSACRITVRSGIIAESSLLARTESGLQTAGSAAFFNDIGAKGGCVPSVWP